MRFLVILLCLAARLAAAPLDSGRAFVSLLQWEGYHLTPYRDGRDMSVGLGHSLTAHGEPVRAHYTDEQCRALFMTDFAAAIRACRAGIDDFDGLPEPVQEVALSICWTSGEEGFMRFKDFRRALSRRAYTAATTALYLSKWYRTQPAARANAAITVLRAQ